MKYLGSNTWQVTHKEAFIITAFLGIAFISVLVIDFIYMTSWGGL